MLSKDELAALRAPFPLDAHTVREGHRSKKGDKIRWFTYVQRNEVQDRLEDIFPGEWATERPEINIQGKSVSALVGITIRGITRWDGGEDDSNEGTKGALTNAFRRTAAYGWHIGRYLYDMDVDIWTDSYPEGDWNKQRERKQEAFNKFADWYRKQFGNAQQPAPSVGIPTQSTPAPQQPQNAGNTPSDAIVGAWVVDLPALYKRLGEVAGNYSSNERANTVQKMHRENEFEKVSNLDSAVTMVVNRLKMHHAKKDDAA